MPRPQFKKRLNPAVGNYPPSLVRSWLEFELSMPGMTKTEALRSLNEGCDTNYRPANLYEWLTGKYQPARPVRNYMLKCAIARVLHRHGIEPLALSDRQLDAMAEDLS